MQAASPGGDRSRQGGDGVALLRRCHVVCGRGAPAGLLGLCDVTSPRHSLHLVSQDLHSEAVADLAHRMMEERDRYRAAMLWCMSPDRCAAGEVLLRAALGELGPGMHREPPDLYDLQPMVRLLKSLPWALEGFMLLASDSDLWRVASAVLCEAAELPDPCEGTQR